MLKTPFVTKPSRQFSTSDWTWQTFFLTFTTISFITHNIIKFTVIILSTKIILFPTLILKCIFWGGIKFFFPRFCGTTNSIFFKKVDLASFVSNPLVYYIHTKHATCTEHNNYRVCVQNIWYKIIFILSLFSVIMGTLRLE